MDIHLPLQPSRSGRASSKAAALAVLATAQLVIALDYSIVNVALPDIGRSLGFTGGTVQWVISAYTLTFGGFLLLGGRAADLLGRRRMFMAALSLFGLASLAGGLAQHAGLLIAARAVQGIGGAVLFPATLSLVNTTFEEGRERNRAIAVDAAAAAADPDGPGRGAGHRRVHVLVRVAALLPDPVPPAGAGPGAAEGGAELPAAGAVGGGRHAGGRQAGRPRGDLQDAGGRHDLRRGRAGPVPAAARDPVAGHPAGAAQRARRGARRQPGRSYRPASRRPDRGAARDLRGAGRHRPAGRGGRAVRHRPWGADPAPAPPAGAGVLP